MPLVVPILRLWMLFLNVYETYKILKPPPPSARNAERPSARATTQRKRNMKGCLAVWIVWCCLAAYDRTLDAIIRLFVPFYDEFKAMVILFFILTRSRGAEPIYLHIIRPLVTPYTDVVDSLLDSVSVVGDIVFIIAALPVRLVITWGHNLYTYTHKVQAAPGPVSHREHEVNGSLARPISASESSLFHQPQSSRRQPSTRRPAYRDGGTRRHASDSYHPPNHVQKRTDRIQRSLHEPIGNGRVAASSSQPTTQAAQPRTTRTHSQANSRPPTMQVPSGPHQIWYPPTSSFDNYSENDEPMPAETSTSSTSSTQYDLSPPTIADPANDEVTHIEISEWRLYPPFPAAYPFTPLPVSSSSQPRSFNYPPTTAVPLSSVSSHEPAEPLPVRPPREPLNRVFNTSSSSGGDSVNATGQNQWAITIDLADDEGDGQGEGEDDFDVTLQTPVPLNRNSRTRTRSHVSNVSTATSSVKTHSTSLTTTGNGSSTHTRTSSSESAESISASDSVSISDHSLMARRKNPVSLVAGPAETVGTSRNTVSSRREMLGWMAGVGTAAALDDGYDATSADSDSTSDISSATSSDDESNVGTASKVQPSEQVTPKQLRTRTADMNKPRLARANSAAAASVPATNGATTRPTSRNRDAPHPPATRKSTRIAGLGAAPPISRRVTAPAPGSSHTGVYTASAVHRHASDKNPAKRK